MQVPVGPEGVVYTFPAKDLWDRVYFRDARSGVNHFSLNDSNVWELRHPALPTIDAEDFRSVAEFFTDGAFGVRFPENQEQNKEAIAQCVGAWDTAERLRLNDMLEHIADKVNYLQWDNIDALAWATTVYDTGGPVLDAHTAMRNWASSYLAHHFWPYIRDKNLSSIFRKRLRTLPELERDVFEKRFENLKAGVEQDEDEESDEYQTDGDGA